MRLRAIRRVGADSCCSVLCSFWRFLSRSVYSLSERRALRCSGLANERRTSACSRPRAVFNRSRQREGKP